MSPPISWIVSPSIQPMSRVIGSSNQLAKPVPVNLKIDFSVKIISCSLNTANPVILSPIRMLPAASPASKFVSKKGAVKVNKSALP